MSEKFSICVATGTRAEYGLLRPVMKKIAESDDLDLQIITTGSHLSKEYGDTYQEIEQDGFEISRKIETLSSSNSHLGIAHSMSLCLNGVVQALDDLMPDLVLVLGDRYEMFSVAQAAMLSRIPIAHVCGGDVAFGTYDNIIRHCITKMASLHFVTHDKAYRRVIQLGEDSEKVYCVGSTCVDNINTLNLLDRESLARSLGISFRKDIFVVTFHPLTMGESTGRPELYALLSVIDNRLSRKDVTIVFTKANADEGGRVVNNVIDDFVDHRSDAYLFDSLGARKYLSLVKQASLVIGNSSSGIYEAPYVGTPTVDIGERQRFRHSPISVFRCDGSQASISDAIDKALYFDVSDVPMVYGDGQASDKIVKVLRDARNFQNLAVKKFVDIGIEKFNNE